MGKMVITRKCAICKDAVYIDTSKLKDVILCDKKYYHKQCFIDRANEIISKNNRYSKAWQEKLDNVPQYERELVNKMRDMQITDELNRWLINNYGLIATPSKRFWTTVNDLNNGKYKGRACVRINLELLTDAWKWAQPRLNKIDASNKNNGKRITGEGRLYYDLAIILSHIPDYMASITKREDEDKDIKDRIKKSNQIDYKSIVEYTRKEHKKDDDLLELMEEIF